MNVSVQVVKLINSLAGDGWTKEEEEEGEKGDEVLMWCKDIIWSYTFLVPLGATLFFSPLWRR